MNIKLHTPKSLKAGSGMGSWKQFWLSLIATTISIVLTFGTAAIIDHNKKEAEKREIVMMVMYDMYNTLQKVEKADSMVQASMETQLQFAEDNTLFEKRRFDMIHLLPSLVYTETVEKIFSSNIETINTIGNVLFAESVSEFYRTRQEYKATVCDTVYQHFVEGNTFSTLQSVINFDYYSTSMISGEFLWKMKQLYAQCMQMMNVTDKQLEVYRKKREEMEERAPFVNAIDSIFLKVSALQKKIDNAMEKQKGKK